MSSFVPLPLAAGICRRVLGLQTRFSYKLFTQQMKEVTNKASQKSCVNLPSSLPLKGQKSARETGIWILRAYDFSACARFQSCGFGLFFLMCFLGFFCSFFKIIQVISKKFHKEPANRCLCFLIRLNPNSVWGEPFLIPCPVLSVLPGPLPVSCTCQGCHLTPAGWQCQLSPHFKDL